MTAQELKNSILQLAIQGKLVKQDPNDEPASVLLEKIKEERKKLIEEKKIKKEKYSEIYKDSSDNHYYEKFEDGTVNDITDEIPFEIPDSWSWTRIGNFEEINLGFTYKPDYTEDGVYFLSVKDISGGKIDFSKAKKVSQKTYDNASYGSKPRKGDILFGRVGTMGKPQIIENDIPFCIFVSLGFFRDYLNLMNKKYICLWMESFLFQQQVNNNVKGAAQKNLNTGWLKNFLIPLPPLNEQERIINKFVTFEYIFDKYENTYNILEKLNNSYKEELKKSILQYAIQGKLVKQNLEDESAEVLIDKVLNEKRELIKTKQIKKENLSVIYKDSTDNQFYEKFDDGKIVNITDEIPFDIPQNWCWTRLGNILTKLTDGTHKTPKYVKNGVPFVSVKDMSSGTLKLNNTKYITKEEHKTLFERCNPQKGDIILSKIGTTGIPVIVETDIEFSLFVSLALLKFNNEYIDRAYLKNLILSPLVQKQCKENTKGVGNKNWVMKDIARTLIVIPPHNEQVKIIEKLDTLFSII